MDFDILARRISNQGLSGKKFTSAAETVKHFCAVQSQDYNGAKWAISLRTDLSNFEIEKEIVSGKIIRTHVMRPTWHFVAAEDIRWPLELTAPRVKSIFKPYNKKLGLNEKTLEKSLSVIGKIVKGKHLQRKEIRAALENSGIDTKGMRFGFILGNAELSMLICSGEIKNGQQTYALFDERVPKIKKKTRDESLQELVLRYFTSHGPATLQDFSWWSGLTIADGKRGIELNKNKLSSKEINGKNYFYSEKEFSPQNEIFLLPNYDEYTVAYKDKNLFFSQGAPMEFSYNAFPNSIVSDGKVVGMWRPIKKKIKGVKESEIIGIEKKMFGKLSSFKEKELDKQEEKFVAFSKL